MATANINPIYNQYFGSSSSTEVDWKNFESSRQQLSSRLSKLPVDFSIENKAGFWKKTAQIIAQIVIFILRVILFPWGLYVLARHIVQRIAMMALFPAQSRIISLFCRVFSTRALDHERAKLNSLSKEGFIVRHVVLNKEGIRYSGILLGHKDTIHNGKWALQATGNAEPIEHSAGPFAAGYKSIGYNVLLINGPSVGRSEGTATPKTMGDAQEIGIRYLEEAVCAKKIVLAGRSLGGVAIGQAILQHKFRDDIKYLIVRQMSFDRVSNVCRKIVGPQRPIFKGIVTWAVKWSGCEIDSVAASKKLQTHGIQEIIVQGGVREQVYDKIPPKLSLFKPNDGVIPKKASLGYRLIKENILGNKTFILTHAHHMANHTIGCTFNQIEAF